MLLGVQYLRDALYHPGLYDEGRAEKESALLLPLLLTKPHQKQFFSPALTTLRSAATGHTPRSLTATATVGPPQDEKKESTTLFWDTAPYIGTIDTLSSERGRGRAGTRTAKIKVLGFGSSNSSKREKSSPNS